MNSDTWYVFADGAAEALGPFSTELIVRGIAGGKIPSTSKVCKVGTEAWTPIDAVPAFGDAFLAGIESGSQPAAAPPTPAPQPRPLPAPDLATSAPRPNATGRRRMIGGGLLVSAAIVAALVLWKGGDANVRAAVHANAKAMNDGDLDAFMATLDETCPGMDDTRAATRRILQEYKLKVEIEKVEVLSANETEAKVRVVQVTRKISGPQFRNNRITLLQTLRNHGSGWRLCSGVDEATEYLP